VETGLYLKPAQQEEQVADEGSQKAIAPKKLPAITNFLKNAKGLSYLDLSKNIIGVQGALILSQALVMHLDNCEKGLVELKLSRN